jgi:drug/metabolite transporter (DMT)-like permease
VGDRRATPVTPVRRLHLVLAFLAVYVLWGSTFLAIRLGVGTIPPFTMVAVRCLIGGTVLFAVARVLGAPATRLRDWRWAIAAGTLLFLTGQGMLAWSQQVVPSGLAALLVATVPLWMTGLDAIDRRRWPGALTWVALLIGFGGVALLLRTGKDLTGAPLPVFPAIVIALGSLGWSAGSLIGRRSPTGQWPTMTAGMQLLGGGCVIAIVAAANGELASLQTVSIAPASMWALAYLLVAGTFIGFVAYTWLLQHASPAAVSTYAYVNPLVAVAIGWGLGGEPIETGSLLAGLAIVASVALVLARRDG